MAEDSPLNMGAPWNAISGVGGAEDIPELQNLHRALAGMKEFQAKLVVDNQDSGLIPKLPPGIEKATLNAKTGKWNYEGVDPKLIERLVSNSNKFEEVLGTFHEEAGRLQAQEQAIRNQPPWVQLATALSANLAQAKDMPGWVQAAGRTAAQLNPRPEAIQAQRMAVLEHEAQLAEKGTALGLHAAQINAQMQEHAASKVTQEENQLEDNYRQVQQKIESEVTANKRVTPEQEQALRVVGAQMKRTPQRIEADLARLRAGATASAQALAEQRKFEVDKAEEAAREADKRLTKTLSAQDRRQAQGQLVTALIPLYKEASWQTKDQDLLQDMSRLDQTFESFLKSHGAAGGPIAGRAAKLMAAFGDPKSQQLLRDQAQVLIDVLKSSGLSFARTSEKEMALIFDSLTRATNNPKVALETAVRYQKWGDKVRERYLQERYAGQYAIVAPYMPTAPLVSGEARPDWQKVQEKHRAAIAKPGTLEEKVLNLPKLISEVAGESGLMKETPQRPTATNDAGETVEWDGKAWVKKK